MKRTFAYILMLVAVLLTAGCRTLDEIDFGSADEVGELGVIYRLEGAEVKSLACNSSSRTVTLDVELNSQEISWSVESDKDWVTVVEEKHRGNGNFTFNVSANKTFDDRETPATLTFVAGAFRGFSFQVTQTGSVFILDKIYEIASPEAGSVQFCAEQDGTRTYDVVSESDWLTVSRGGQPTGGGNEQITLSWTRNTSGARYGKVRLVTPDVNDAEPVFSVYQFGNEVTILPDGNIQVDSKDAGVISIMAPQGAVDSLKCPEWITSSSELSESAQIWHLAISDNPSDYKGVRVADSIGVYLHDINEPVWSVPLCQDYYPIGSIATGKGFTAFADAWNSGEDLSDWKNADGYFTLSANPDFSDVGQWQAVGTVERPFNGKFKGDYFMVGGLKASEPLFGVCENADISSLIIGGDCLFSVDQAGSDYTLAALAAELRGGCTIESCENRADVIFRSRTEHDVCVGGMFGVISGENRIIRCINSGNVSMTGKAVKDALVCIGGIWARNDAAFAGDGTLVNKGRVTFEPYMPEDKENEIDYKGWSTSQPVNIGGVAGMTVADLSGVRNEGLVTFVEDASSSDVTGTGLNMGGIVGVTMAASPLTVSDCENSGEVNMNVTGVKRLYSAIYLGGIVGHCPLVRNDLQQVTISNCTNSGTITGGLNVKNSDGNKYFGGIVGYFRGKQICGCVNSGTISNTDYNNGSASKAPIVGGIAGRIRGTGEDAIATMAGCTVEQVSGQTYYSKRGWQGGLAGMANFTHILNCDCRLEGHSGSAPYFGGLCGQLTDSVAEGCNCVSNMLNVSQYTLKAIGGIAAITTGTSTIKGCTYNGSMSSDWKDGVFGGIVGNVDGTLHAIGNTYGGFINEVEMTADTAFGSGTPETDENNGLTNQ